ncbi:MAG: DUF5671 domain-containing protein [bacterium]|nr:DUF5671 domain-containing protein [bacterium]
MDKPKTTPKDFFLYFAGFVTLYVSAISLVNLLFSIINKVFPDNLNNGYYYDYYSTGMRLSIASLVIVFPIFLFLASYLNKYLLATPEKRDLAVRKWLTYLTLFVTGVAVVSDLVVLVNTFLGGEITTRFVLKVLAVLIVAGAIFAYYIYDLRKNFAFGQISRTKLLVTLSCVLVFGSLIAGFALIGSPMSARDRKFDERRVSDLQSIQWQIISYWQQKGEIPVDLDNLKNPISNSYTPTDPVTGEVYRYKATSDLSFQLCANFSSSNVNVTDPVNDKPMPLGYGMADENWIHDAGETCFDRTIDIDLYPVRAKGI